MKLWRVFNTAILAVLVHSLIFAPVYAVEQRKVTQPDVEWGPSTDNATSSGGHVGGKIPRYYDNNAFTDNLTLYGKGVTGDNTGRVQGFSIGSASYTDNGYFADLIAKGPWVDVRAYGADNTGTVDSTAAINTAISATPTGGTVKFPGGTYKISGAEAVLFNKSGITYDCEGATFDYGAGTGTALRIGGAAGVQVSDITVKGPFVTGTSESAIGILVQNVTRSRFHGLRSNVAGTGLKIYALHSGATYANTSLNDFYGVKLYNSNIDLLVDCAIGATNYVTTQSFYGGQIYGGPTTALGSRTVEIKNTNAANQTTGTIKFFGTVIEGTHERKLKDAGASNLYEGVNWDASNGGTDIEFTSTSANNLITNDMTSGIQVITDAGSANWEVVPDYVDNTYRIGKPGANKYLTVNQNGQVNIVGTAYGIVSFYNGEIVLGSVAGYQFKISGDSDTPGSTLYIDSATDSAASKMRFRLRTAGTPAIPLELKPLNINIAAPAYDNAAAAAAGGLVTGDVYRTGDALMVIH